MLKVLTSVAVLIVFIAHPVQSQAIQPPPPVTQTQPPFAFVEVMPVFKGGQAAMYKFISDNIEYPDSARINGIQGQVIAQFVVDIDSLTKEVKIVRGIGYGCNEEVLRIFELMNAQKSWIPGRHKGVAVPVSFTLPIKFILSDDQKSTMPKTD